MYHRPPSWAATFHVFLCGETSCPVQLGRGAFGLRSRRRRRTADRRGLVWGRRKATPGDAAHARSSRGAVQLAGRAIPRQPACTAPTTTGVARTTSGWRAGGRSCATFYLCSSKSFTVDSTVMPRSGCARCATATQAFIERERARARRRNDSERRRRRPGSWRISRSRYALPSAVADQLRSLLELRRRRSARADDASEIPRRSSTTTSRTRWSRSSSRRSASRETLADIWVGRRLARRFRWRSRCRTAP